MNNKKEIINNEKALFTDIRSWITGKAFDHGEAIAPDSYYIIDTEKQDEEVMSNSCIALKNADAVAGYIKNYLLHNFVYHAFYIPAAESERGHEMTYSPSLDTYPYDMLLHMKSQPMIDQAELDKCVAIIKSIDDILNEVFDEQKKTQKDFLLKKAESVINAELNHINGFSASIQITNGIKEFFEKIVDIAFTTTPNEDNGATGKSELEDAAIDATNDLMKCITFSYVDIEKIKKECRDD